MMQAAVLKRFWAVCREQGISSDVAHQRVFEEFGKEHISTLKDNEALYIIDCFLGKRGKKPRSGHWATEKQIWLIKKLTKELGWENDPKRLLGFLRKYVHCDYIEWLSKAQASMAIEGLKGLLRNSGGDK